MTNFVEQIPIKFGGFYVIKMNLVQTVLSANTLKYLSKFVYRPILKRSNIGELIYWPVFSSAHLRE